MPDYSCLTVFIKNLDSDSISESTHTPCPDLIADILTLTGRLVKKDAETFLHSKRVADICMLFSDRIGLPENQRDMLYVTAFLHDIGKLTVPDFILKKNGTLTDDEYGIIRGHAEAGGRTVKELFADETLEKSVRHHHEKYDGSGYPGGLRGNEIPLFSRIISVADSFDAMQTRSHSEKKERSRALTEIIRNAGTQFDAEIAESFVEFGVL